MLNPQAFIFGFTQGFVIGPITLFGIREGLDPKRGFWYQMQVIFGATMVDILYLLLSSYGAAQFIEHDLVKLIMWSVASYLLLSMGYHSFFEKPHRLSIQNVHKHRSKFYETDFFRALLMNLVNPLAIVFWVMVAGSLYTNYATTVTPMEFAISIVVGGTISAVLVAIATLLVKQVFHEWMLKKLLKLGSLVLIAYGLYFSYQAILALQPVTASALELINYGG
jgi:threonine/homoserine/homoserine lactone efflux protein